MKYPLAALLFFSGQFVYAGFCTDLFGRMVQSTSAQVEEVSVKIENIMKNFGQRLDVPVARLTTEDRLHYMHRTKHWLIHLNNYPKAMRRIFYSKLVERLRGESVPVKGIVSDTIEIEINTKTSIAELQDQIVDKLYELTPTEKKKDVQDRFFMEMSLINPSDSQKAFDRFAAQIRVLMDVNHWNRENRIAVIIRDSSLRLGKEQLRDRALFLEKWIHSHGLMWTSPDLPSEERKLDKPGVSIFGLQLFWISDRHPIHESFEDAIREKDKTYSRLNPMVGSSTVRWYGFLGV
ncbi:MAG: hypothetical protein CL678_18390 [Bdellovibrionaceae bacterium]|nr:hypothetical protein [Pseudobdellovibrionaceae bacterium]|tara:strand:+ start:790 stop:1665 length:876 start_codon:yes stop_codon:yes gene_type:complete